MDVGPRNIMKDLIYMPVMIFNHIFYKNFFSILANEIKKFDTPEGVKIINVYDGSDNLLEHIFDRVVKKNADPEKEHPDYRNEPYTMLEIEVESEQSIRYQPLQWLDDQIKEVVRNREISTGLYFFYLIDKGTKFHNPNIGKVITKDGDKIYEDDRTDDFSPLYEMAPYLKHYWYLHPQFPIDEEFPDLTAKLYLLFG